MKRYQVNINIEIKELLEKTYIGDINILSCNNIINKIIDEILLLEKKDINNIIKRVKDSVWNFKSIKCGAQMVYFLDFDKLNAIEKLSDEINVKKQDLIRDYIYYILLENKKDNELSKIFDNKINIKCYLEGIIYKFPKEITNITLSDEDMLIIETSLNKLRNKKPKLEKYYGKELIYDLMLNIYKYIHKTDFSLGELTRYINKETRAVQEWIKALGWEINVSKSHNRAKRDYKAIRSKGRQTLLNNATKGGLTEDYIRQLFNIHLSEILKDCECIVGQNNLSILENGKEIDIPIIIIKNDSVYKFAVEVDGEYWHQDQVGDDIKKKMITDKGYKFYNVKLNYNTKTQNERYGQTLTQVISICKGIKDCII